MIGLNMEAVLAAKEGSCVTSGVSRWAPPNWPITEMKAYGDLDKNTRTDSIQKVCGGI